MEKQAADQYMMDYNKKLFGFALSKTRSLEAAEELASQITLEVYAALLKRENIANPNSYIYRIAQNVYARSVDAACKKTSLSVHMTEIPAKGDFTEELAQSEAYMQLRREIAYLSKVQREIIIRHYFDRMKLEDIARELAIPLGTVKWHMYEAKHSLKEGMINMRQTGSLGLKPVRFCSMGHSGSAGHLGDTNDFLKKRLTQNIAYAAYHEPKTVNEIAEELAVSPLFVEDEVSILEEYGFMDRLPGNKYRTEIFITEPDREIGNKQHEIYRHYAGLLCTLYVPDVIEAMRGMDKADIYIPDNDMNLLFWAAITYSIGNKLQVKNVDHGRFSVKRKDGGDYIAFASLEAGFESQYDAERYRSCGDMRRGSDKYPVMAWQFNTYYDSRELDWRSNRNADFEYVYEYLCGSLNKEPSQMDKYRRVCDMGYVQLHNGREQLNLIVTRTEGGKEFSSRLSELLPKPSEAVIRIGEELDKEIYELNKSRYPKHMQQLFQAFSSNCMSDNNMRTRVLEQLVQSGVLTEPSDHHKSGLNTIVFSDILPQA